MPNKNYCYNSGYEKPDSISEQENELKRLFPGLGDANCSLQDRIGDEKIFLPEGAEGFFAIPNWVKRPDVFGPRYDTAVSTVIEKMKLNFNFQNDCVGSFNANNLKQISHTEKNFEMISEKQGCPDIILIAAQLGMRYKGLSPAQTRENLRGTSQFVLNIFASAIILLTNKKRMEDELDLHMGCGDCLTPFETNMLIEYPSFKHREGKLILATNCRDTSYFYMGVPTGWGLQIT